MRVGSRFFGVMCGLALFSAVSSCSGNGGGSGEPPPPATPPPSEPPSTPPPIPPQASWTEPETISPATGGAGDVKVAIGAAGNALAVWRQLNSGVFGRSLWVSRYVNGSGWSAPVLLENDDADIDKFTIAMQADTGRTTVAWTQLTTVTPSGAFDVWARAFDPASGWGTSALHESTTDPAQAPALAVNDRGDAVVAWTQLFTNGGSRIVARHYHNQ